MASTSERVAGEPLADLSRAPPVVLLGCGIARIRDTTPAFEAFARKAGLESPLRRELLWKSHYEAANADVFRAFEEVTDPPQGGMAAMVKELSGIRTRVREAAPIMTGIIEELDPKLAELLGVPPEPSPVHVLMVGTFVTNSAVGRLGGDVAVFHCMEWFQTPEGTRVLVAHEGTHAWHELALERERQTMPKDDMAWMVFTEGLATQASRAAVPEGAEIDYFWYGHPEAQDWLPWCQQHIEELRKHVRASLDIPEAIETFFGGGLVDGKWRVGYYLADQVVGGLGRSLPELAAMSVDEARQAVRDALDT